MAFELWGRQNHIPMYNIRVCVCVRTSMCIDSQTLKHRIHTVKDCSVYVYVYRTKSIGLVFLLIFFVTAYTI